MNAPRSTNKTILSDTARALLGAVLCAHLSWAAPAEVTPCPGSDVLKVHDGFLDRFVTFIHGTANGHPGSEGRQSFNDGWRFFKGEAPGAERPDFQDSRWAPTQLPHDWAIDGPFDIKNDPNTGGLPVSGTGWYRKSFALPASAKGHLFRVEFDGAMANARVWVNGHDLGSRPYGYSGFAFNLTPYLNFDGKPNVLAVRLAPEPEASRWYSGAGIYRNVWLDVSGPLHVKRWGTFVTTPEVTDSRATVQVRTELSNQSAASTRAFVRSSVLDPSGRLVSQKTVPVEAPGSGDQAVSTELTVEHPQRWDIDQPKMYSLVSEVLDSEHRVLDRYVTPFGIRTIDFDKDKGFRLNGRALKIQGANLHHDLGALGAAVNRRATERELQILKAAGVNAIRTSHNPPSPELLEYCDRLGLMVMDEAFDMWKRPKVENGYSKYFDEWSERDLRDMVARDRNHPSIIMYSIGNEVPEQDSPDGAPIARRLVKFFHEEDPTRPTTSGFNYPDDAIKNGLASEVDLVGVNYSPWKYESIKQAHPDWKILGSETGSCVSSRGVYHLPIEKYETHPSRQISSYDIIAPRMVNCPDVDFFYQDRSPSVLGQFVWTGFDYLGEPAPYFGDRGTPASDWPARSSYFGMVDLAGFPKDRYYLYQSVWTKKPMVHVLPHWNWPGMEGQPIPVFAYTNADEVELFLNGKSLGRKQRFGDPVTIPVGPNVNREGKFVTKYRLEWQVPYQPGRLTAVAYRGGKKVAEDDVRTAGAPARIRLEPDRPVIHADGSDLSYVTVRIEDKDGNLCPMADNPVHFDLSGAGGIRAVDNGNAASIEPFRSDRRKAFNGMALLIVGSQRGKSGKIEVTATSPGLAPASTELTAVPAAAPRTEVNLNTTARGHAR